MNRRGFLSTLGAALSAPLLPALPAAAAPAGVNRYTYGLAALHTRIEQSVSLSELSGRLQLSAAQSRALAEALVSDGIATQTGGSLHATQPLHKGTLRAASAQGQHRPKIQETQAALDPLRQYLYDLCAQRGITVAPTPAHAPHFGGLT